MMGNPFAAPSLSITAANRRDENQGGPGSSMDRGDNAENGGGPENVSSSARSEETFPSKLLADG